MFAYSDHVWDLLNGARTIDQVVKLGVPELHPRQTTDTARAFGEVEKLLKREVPKIQDGPAPIVCHMTDGEFTGADPEPVVRRIKEMAVADGNVLIENIFISDQLLAEPIADIRAWPGVTAQTPDEP